MQTTSEIWLAFGRMFGMLFVVMALIVAGFYLVKRFSVQRRGMGRNLISTLAVHHISPKEKLVLVQAVNEVLLLGVTTNHISTLTRIDPATMDTVEPNEPAQGFASVLSGMISRSGTQVSQRPLEDQGRFHQGAAVATEKDA